MPATFFMLPWSAMRIGSKLVPMPFDVRPHLGRNQLWPRPLQAAQSLLLAHILSKRSFPLRMREPGLSFSLSLRSWWDFKFPFS